MQSDEYKKGLSEEELAEVNGDTIVLSRDLVYKLIRELRETYMILPDNTPLNALKRHGLKIRYKLLETILNDKFEREFERAKELRIKSEIGDLIKQNKIIKIHTDKGLIDYIEGVPEGYSYEVIDND